MKSFPDCYGTIIPAVSRFKSEGSRAGQLFDVQVDHVATGAAGISSELRKGDWSKCIECPDYRTCYDLSLAELLLKQVSLNTKAVNPWIGDYGEKHIRN